MIEPRSDDVGCGRRRRLCVAATDEIAPERRRTSARVVNWSGHPNESADESASARLSVFAPRSGSN